MLYVREGREGGREGGRERGRKGGRNEGEREEEEEEEEKEGGEKGGRDEGNLLLTSEYWHPGGRGQGGPSLSPEGMRAELRDGGREREL